MMPVLDMTCGGLCCDTDGGSGDIHYVTCPDGSRKRIPQGLKVTMNGLDHCGWPYSAGWYTKQDCTLGATGIITSDCYDALPCCGFQEPPWGLSVPIISGTTYSLLQGAEDVIPGIFTYSYGTMLEATILSLYGLTSGCDPDLDTKYSFVGSSVCSGAYDDPGGFGHPHYDFEQTVYGYLHIFATLDVCNVDPSPLGDYQAHVSFIGIHVIKTVVTNANGASPFANGTYYSANRVFGIANGIGYWVELVTCTGFGTDFPCVTNFVDQIWVATSGPPSFGGVSEAFDCPMCSADCQSSVSITMNVLGTDFV